MTEKKYNKRVEKTYFQIYYDCEVFDGVSTNNLTTA